MVPRVVGTPIHSINTRDDKVRVRRAFSLVEYLIVCAIVLVLSGIVTVVVVRAKESAKNGHCQNNLRLICQSLPLYAEDYDGWAPHYTTYRSGNGEGIKTAAEPQKWRESLSPFIKDQSAFHCPQDPVRGPMNRNFNSTHTSYRAPASGLVSSFAEPGVWQMNVGLNLNTPNPYIADESWPDSPANPNFVPYRWLSVHGEKANFGFLDGSVKFASLNGN